MRLSQQEVSSIKRVIAEFDPNAVIYLYGSRIDDNKKGGDIDLLILSATITLEQKLQMRIRLFDEIGEQKIDTLILKEPNTAFAKLAIEQGIKL